MPALRLTYSFAQVRTVNNCLKSLSAPAQSWLNVMYNRAFEHNRTSVREKMPHASLRRERRFGLTHLSKQVWIVVEIVR
jgi:hypothetical protein